MAMGQGYLVVFMASAKAMAGWILVLAIVGPIRAQPQLDLSVVLPTVISADVPQYPREAAKAGTSGAVSISVTTDGHNVVSVRLLKPQPGASILGETAVGNVRTWRFAAHEATTFDTTFRFQIVDRSCQSLGRDTHAAAVIHFPTEVEIFTERDPACDGATRLPPTFGIYIKEASIPFYPAAARARGIAGTVRISMTYKGVLSVADGPDELGQPIINAMREWTLNAGPYTEEMKFTYTLADGECRGGPVVTIGPGLTSYEVIDTRSCGR
jgi:TonB family protein